MSSKRFKKLPQDTFNLPAELIEKSLNSIKKNCTTKFEESIDLSFQINNKQKKSEINIRTVVNLPAGTGKKVKVAVVCEDNKAKEAKDAGADIVGGEDFVEKIKNGELNFEKLICTPGMMIKLAKLGKVLGPKGLMPNPKLGSVSEDLKTAVSNAKSGQVEIRSHSPLGQNNTNSIYNTMSPDSPEHTSRVLSVHRNSYIVKYSGAFYAYYSNSGILL